jgi:two-component system, cell cycle sensor histidine kinase and response regulator CckA
MAFLFKRSGKEANRIQDKIVVIETLIFALPFLILFYIIHEGDYHFDPPHIILFGGIAVFILAGMIILRQILDRVSVVAQSFKKAESGDTVTIDLKNDVTELHEISLSLNNLVQKLDQTSGELAQRSFELSTIGNLTEIIKANLSMDDQLNLLLEKSMALTGAQIGSAFIVEPETRQKQSVMAASSGPLCVSQLFRFRVCAAIGHDEELKKGTFVDIDRSIARTVLLERRPLLIRDISKDPRTAKNNDPKYGPPSFLSMPILMGDTVFAILNLAYKGKGQLFDSNDEQVLSIMLRDIGFALENAMLQSGIRKQLEKIKGHTIEMEKEIEKRARIERALRESEKNV